MNTLPLLLKREYWEHRGGMLWAPIWITGVFLLITVLGIVTAEVFRGHVQMHSGFSLDQLRGDLAATDFADAGQGLDVVQMMLASFASVGVFFVSFFYLLGALYDDRRDRSVLFWKSLPLSDRDTVLSKVASAVVVAPLIATAAALLTMFGFLLIASGLVMMHGGSPMQLLWGPGSPLTIAVQFVAAIPVYALWALPTVGWLLLCSAWARSKPFLWALMIPAFAGIFVSWFDIMQVFNLESTWFWKNIVARLLLGTVPGSWFNVAHFDHIDADGPQVISQVVNLQSMYSVLLTPQLWLGVLAGAAMIVAAIRLRRWRDEG